MIGHNKWQVHTHQVYMTVDKNTWQREYPEDRSTEYRESRGNMLFDVSKTFDENKPQSACVLPIMGKHKYIWHGISACLNWSKESDLIIYIHLPHFWLHTLPLLLLQFFAILFLDICLECIRRATYYFET
jgi:hypothetical protein